MTNNSFIQMVSERHPNISVLGEYQHCNKPVNCYCNLHKLNFDATPRNLERSKENGGCPICIKERGDSTKKLTHKEFVERVLKRIPNIQILDNYVNNTTKIKCYCDVHNNTWSASPKELLNGSGCRQCGLEKSAQSRTKTQEEFENQLYQIFPNIKVIGEYVTANSKIKCFCTIHNHTWEATPGSLLWGEGCPKCGIEMYSEKHKLSQEEYESRVFAVNQWIESISNYSGCVNDITFKCRECGIESTYSARTLFSHIECPVCRNRKIAQGINDIATTHPYIVPYLKNPLDSQKYKANSNCKIIFKCPICGDEKELKINQTIQNGYHCTFCDEGISTPNRIIRNLLRNLNATNRDFEYSPKWAGRFRYDAYFEHNNNYYVVEMDGGFHFKSAKSLGITEQSVKETKKRDNIKDELAKEHNITMIRIKCVPETLENIITQLKNSILADMFDLENVDWNGLLYYKDSLLTEVCNCYNNSDYKSASYVSRAMGISHAYAKKYLLRGTDLGLCCYNPKNVQRKRINTIPALAG